MKRSMMTVAAAAMLGIGGGGAQADSQSITIGASVSGFCSFDGFGGSVSAAFEIDDATGKVVDENVAVEVGDVKCNGNTKVQLSSAKGGVFSPDVTTAPAGFETHINYLASVSAPAPASVAASATTPTPTNGTALYTGGPTNSTGVTVTIDPTANTNPLVAASNYSDTLTLTIAAQ